MTQIVPTITAATADDFARELTRLDFAPRLHIDITDGSFAPSQTINLNQVYWNDDKIIDLHLMVRRPAEWLHQIVALGPNLVVLHAEAENLPQIFEHCRKFDIKCGVALLPETTPEQAEEIIAASDHALIFGGHLGYQGGTADLKQLKKVKKIRDINPRAEIAWDGGARAENVAEIARDRVDVINVGAAIGKTENPAEAYENLLSIANK